LFICLLLTTPIIQTGYSLNDMSTTQNLPFNYVQGYKQQNWTEEQKLTNQESRYLGWSVSLDDDTALIGAPIDDDNGPVSGSAYVFTRSGTAWTLQQKLLASDGAAHDRFGSSVSVSGDTVLIGAMYAERVMMQE
jgi:hypothetical protein